MSLSNSLESNLSSADSTISQGHHEDAFSTFRLSELSTHGATINRPSFPRPTDTDGHINIPPLESLNGNHGSGSRGQQAEMVAWNFPSMRDVYNYATYPITIGVRSVSLINNDMRGYYDTHPGSFWAVRR